MAKRTCSIDGCENPHRTLNWCDKHYQRYRHNGDPLIVRTLKGVSPEARFAHYVDKSGSGGCWIWTGGRSPRGYGLLKVNGVNVRAHRFSYELHAGPIPNGLRVLHRCDNPPCVNPAHLWLGTDADNVHDCVAKGRARGGGLKLTPAVREEIRGRYTGKRGEFTALAREYDVHPGTIGRLFRGGK